jgi:hypothetical protein
MTRKSPGSVRLTANLINDNFDSGVPGDTASSIQEEPMRTRRISETADHVG